MARKVMAPDKLANLAIKEFSKAFENQSDIACVLIAGAFIENATMTLLASFFVKCETSKNAFSEGAVLGDFGKCTTIAYCLGLITNSMRSWLVTIGKIRNLFAHHPGSLSFDNDEVKACYKGIVLPESKINKDGIIVPLSESEIATRDEWLSATNDRMKFEKFAQLVFVTLITVIISVKSHQRKEQPEIWLDERFSNVS